MAEIPRTEKSNTFPGLTLQELLTVRTQLNEALLNRISGIQSLSRGGTSSAFTHLSKSEIKALQLDLKFALNELNPVAYPLPTSTSIRKVF